MRPHPFVVPMLLGITLTARGDEPRRVEDVFSATEGVRAIVYIAAEGTHVTKGQVVCALDAVPAPEGLESRKAIAALLEASYQQAKLTREAAEATVVAYEQGVFRQSLETVEGDIAVARSELNRAEDRLESRRRQLEKNPPRYADGGSQITSDKFNVDKARFVLEQAEAAKAVLLKYTKDKTVKELRSEVEKARSDELARKTLEVERSKVREIESRVQAAVVLAPIDGTVKLARPTKLVEAGAEVCKDQLLLRIVPGVK